MKKLNLPVALLLATAMAMPFGACEKEEGPTGPQGEPGSIDMVYSEWMDIVWNQNDEPEAKVMLIEEPALSPGFFDSGGVVFAFLRQQSGPEDFAIAPLPLVFTNYTMRYSYYYIENQIVGLAIIAASTINQPIPVDFSDIQIRYLLVPGGVPLAGSSINVHQEEVDWAKLPYARVKELLNLKD